MLPRPSQVLVTNPDRQLPCHFSKTVLRIPSRVNSPAVKPGDTVTAGQKLGTVGTISCECAEEAHIHLEVLQNGQYLDPAKIS